MMLYQFRTIREEDVFLNVTVGSSATDRRVLLPHNVLFCDRPLMATELIRR